MVCKYKNESIENTYFSPYEAALYEHTTRNTEAGWRIESTLYKHTTSTNAVTHSRSLFVRLDKLVTVFT